MNKDEENTKSYGGTWEEISENTYPSLLRCAVRLTDGNEDDARDLIQDAFCKVIRYSIKPEVIANPVAYLATVLKNLWIDNLNKRRRMKMQSIDEYDDDDERRDALLNKLPKIQPDALRLLENKEYQKALRIAMHKLTPPERSVLRLFLSGLDCDEIAAELGKDVYRVKYELNAVRAKIRYRLDRQTKAANS